MHLKRNGKVCWIFFGNENLCEINVYYCYTDKISLVKAERNSIILYTERLLARTTGSPVKGGEEVPQTQTREKQSSLLDMVLLFFNKY